MQYCNREKINKLKYNENELLIVADFDKTMTSGEGESTWGIMSKSGLVDEEYYKERMKLYEYYRPIEINYTMSYEERCKEMEEWWKKHISLYFKYQITEEQIKKAVAGSGLEFRKGAKEFLIQMYEKNVPVIIISAGIGNIIEEFLKKEESYFDNIFVISNFMKFEDEKSPITSFSENIIHSLNKNTASIPEDIKEIMDAKKQILLFGDGLEDSLMVEEQKESITIKIAFLDKNIEDSLPAFQEKFDIILTDNASFDDAVRILKA